MSRLDERQSQYLMNWVQRLEQQLLELKTTPQPTSNRSGVLTYQVPELEDWQEVEWVDHNGATTRTNALQLPPTLNAMTGNLLELEYSYTPSKQNAPIIYPFIELSIDGAEWRPFYSPSLGMGFRSVASKSNAVLYMSNVAELTDYAAGKLLYKWRASANYTTNSSDHSPTLNVRFRLRSTDRGEVSVKIKSYRT